ncbi:MAG: Tyrosine recombinase XerC [Syntrophorhabdaceae bacterium PtaU1.Bin034]|nr:MAG: Tyrosine recombinase XerC [Syntrophorhabdaceae bacterium PtaU1.Bin034]
MKTTDFAQHLTNYLSVYLPGQRNLSSHTIASYRDTFKLLLIFCEHEKALSPERLTLAHIDEDLVRGFMSWIEITRRCGIATRNQRLAAIHAFFRYLQSELPERLMTHQRILAIPSKKTGKPAVSYLTAEALEAILKQPDHNSSAGRRDLVLLTVLYDSGARVGELTDLIVRDVRLMQPATITLKGKGRKVRHVPLMSKTALLLKDYLEEKRLAGTHTLDHAVFFNSRHEKLTRAGVSYVINKYVQAARRQDPTVLSGKVSPHVFRHTKAMHLLQANVNLVYIRDFLGHASVTTSEIYARADTHMKRLALEQAYSPAVADNLPTWQDDKNLLTWLQRLCK